jgi:hypothetical protein
MPGRAGRWDGSLTRRPARRPSGVAVWGFCKSLGYQFVFDGKDYFISCTLEKATDRTRRLAHGVYKYQLSSTSIPDRKIFKYQKEN